MGGHTKKVSTAPAETAGLRNSVQDFLMQQGPGAIRTGAQPGTDSIDTLGGANSAFFQNLMTQLRPQFDQQRAEGLAAAKEAAGNLTGSGFGNTLGAAVNRSLANENATAAQFANQALQLEMQRQQADANRVFQGQQNDAQRFLQMLYGMSTAGLGPDTIQKSGGIGSIFGPIGGVLGTAIAGPIGGAIGGKISGMF